MTRSDNRLGAGAARADRRIRPEHGQRDQVRSCDARQPWPTGPVTLLGDAIYNMTPMAGIGANTALRDADLLRRQLIAVASGERDLIPALHEYEEQMLD